VLCAAFERFAAVERKWRFERISGGQKRRENAALQDASRIFMRKLKFS
jgi:hypothetical protein